MTHRTGLGLMALLALGASGAVIASSRDGAPRHDAPPSASGDMVVQLCDGETTAEIPGVKEGETPTRAQAQDVADRLMVEWRRKNPNVRWEGPIELAQANPADRPMPPQDTSRIPPPSPGAGVEPESGERKGLERAAPDAARDQERGSTTPGEAAAGGGTTGGAGGLPAAPQGEVQAGHTYKSFSDRDLAIWAAETDKFVKEGHRIFHDANAIGSLNAVSCDMCHPDGRNTHPETYPKFQVQLGRVALLRDMINWCIQNPSRGKPLVESDRRMKALEAYILAQRNGVAIEFGKH
jgi:thiosulfate dehydrogenase